MKTRKHLGTVCLCVISTSAMAQLSSTYDHCIARARKNTVQVGICVQKEMANQDTRLNQIYQTKMKSLANRPDEKAALRAEELAWLKQRDSECKVNGETVDNVCVLRKTAERADTLEQPSAR